MLTKRIVLIVLWTTMFICADAQKSDYHLKLADKAYQSLQYESAASLYERYFQSNVTNIDAVEKIADCYWKLRNYSKASRWYAQLDPANVASNENIKRRVAELKAMQEDYQGASSMLDGMYGFQQRASGFRNSNSLKRDSSDWSINYLNINTQQYREFSPVILDKKFVWSSNQPKSNDIKGVMGWDANGYIRQFYLSSLDDLQKVMAPKGGIDTSYKGNLKLARHHTGADVSLKATVLLPKSLVNKNKYRLYQPQVLQGFEALKFNIGHATASSETKKLYTSINIQGDIKRGVVRKIGIVEAEYGPGGVSNIHFLDLGSTDDNCIHPAVDDKGEYLVFSSDRNGGKGGYDLYMIKKSADGSWSSPVSLDDLNTSGNELFSSFSPDGDLFYSSDGMQGLGGLDIYKVQFTNGIITSAPEHLSYPLNSPSDEFGIHVIGNGETGFFSSDRFGSDDIFSFKYNQIFSPISGFVIDQTSMLRTKNVRVVLYLKGDDGSLLKIDSAFTDKNGNYTFPKARPNRDYQVIAFDPDTDKVDIATITTSSVSENNQSLMLFVGALTPSAASMPSVASDSVFVKSRVNASSSVQSTIASSLSDVPQRSSASHVLALDSVYFMIYFDFDKYSLTTTSIANLNRAVLFLKNNPDYGFILLGHTDLKGNVDYNIKLSKNRVYAAYNYMVANGIDPKRLELEYYGKSRPLKLGLTQDDDRLNRRVEFILINK